MLDETVVRAEDGRAVQQVRFYCDGTKEEPHPRAQVALFAHEEGAAWPDGHAHWEWVDGDGDGQYVTDRELTAREVARAARSNDPSLRGRLILRCRHCSRSSRVLRRRLERLLSGAIVHTAPVRPSEWELPVSILNPRRRVGASVSTSGIK